MARQYLPPRPLWNRAIHWAGFFGLSMVLIVTAAFLHFPDLIKGPLGVMAGLHVSSSMLLAALVAIWVYLEWQIKDSRIHGELSLSRSVFKGAWRQLVFYSLPKREPAEFMRLNPLQVILYHLWAVIFLFLLLSGFALWSPESVTGRGVTNLLGGPQPVVGLHVALAAAFLGALIIHIYIAVLDALVTKNGSMSSITLRRR